MKSLHNTLECFIAVAAFAVATALSFTALIISDKHEIAAGVCLVVAQFLLLCSAALHIDLKLHNYGRAFRIEKQQPSKHQS